MDRKLFVNADGDLFWWMYESVNGNVDDFENKIRTYVRGYKDKGISDLLFCCFCQQSFFPTKVLDWWGDKYYQTVENGLSVDYKNLNRVKHVVDIYNVMEKDPFDVLISEARSCGMNGWISIRMNDHHCQKEPTSFLHGKFYYEAKEKGWFIGEETGGELFSECYDYAVEEVRERMLNYVYEVLDRYDMDGLELDFMREIYCFNYIKNPDCHKIMTGFMQKVREYLRVKEVERGHQIKLAIRLNRDVNESKIYGFDAKEFVKQDLVDVIIPTSRWFSTDTDMPIGEWKKITLGTNVEILAGVESFLFHPVLVKDEVAKGLTVQYVDAGADGMYLFNIFRTCVEPENIAKEICLFKGDSAFPVTALSQKEEEKLAKIWNACYNINIARSGVRRHVMSYQEAHATPITVEGYRPLPSKIEGKKSFTLQTGNCDNCTCSLFVGVKQGMDIPTIKVDGYKATIKGSTDEAYVCDRNNAIFNPLSLVNTVYYRYEIQTDDTNIRKIEISAENSEVTYIEIMAISK